ncbi:MAG: terminase [Clostridia bacterium]|nr:terminase [Clostridia bacterium]
MAGFYANRVLSGSFAEIWIDGNRIAEASGIQMTVKLQRSDVQIGMDVDSKITGWKGEGQLRLRQVFSRFFDIVEGAGEGRDIRVTITTALKDPDSMNGEEERYSVDNVALDSLPLVNYATGKVNEQVVPFRFLPSELKQLSAINLTEVA